MKIKEVIRFPNFNIFDGQNQNRGGNIADPVFPYQRRLICHWSKDHILYSVLRRRKMVLANSRSDVHFGNGSNRSMASNKLPNRFGMTLQVSDRLARREMEGFDSLGNHQTMPNFGKNSHQCKTGNLLTFPARKKFRARVVHPKKMIDKDVGIDKQTLSGGDIGKHLTSEGAELGRFGDEPANFVSDMNDSFGQSDRAVGILNDDFDFLMVSQAIFERRIIPFHKFL